MEERSSTAPGGIANQDSVLAATLLAAKAARKQRRREQRQMETPIIVSERVEHVGRWMSRKTAHFKDGDASNGRTAKGSVCLMELEDGDKDLFKLQFSGFQVENTKKWPLYMYFSQKQARRQDGQIEEAGFRFNTGAGFEGQIADAHTSGEFEQNLFELPFGPLEVMGLYIIKPADMAPRTSEAVVFAYANLEDFDLAVKKSTRALQMTRAIDEVDQYKHRKIVEAAAAREANASKGSKWKLGVSRKQSGCEAPKVDLSICERHAARAWRKFAKSAKKDTADYHGACSSMETRRC